VNRKPRTPSELPEPARQLWQAFVNAANKSMVHTLDEERFLRFAVYCYSFRVRLHAEEVERWARRERFPAATAKWMKVAFEVTPRVLRLRRVVRATSRGKSTRA